MQGGGQATAAHPGPEARAPVGPERLGAAPRLPFLECLVQIVVKSMSSGKK